MINVSQNLRDAFKSTLRQPIFKISIDGVMYENDSIVDLELDTTLSPDGNFHIGQMIAKKLSMNLRVPIDVLNDMVEIELFFGLDLSIWNNRFDNWEDENVAWVDDKHAWVKLGNYYVIERKEINRRYSEVVCLDSTIFTNVDYESQLTYPSTFQAVFDELIATAEIETENIVLPNYEVYVMPTDGTVAEILRYLAGASGGSFYFNAQNKLELKLYSKSEVASDTIQMKDYYKLAKLNEVMVIKGVRLYEKDEYTEGEYIETIIGSGNERELLSIKNPFVTEEIHQDLYERFNGFSYQPIEMEYSGLPYLECGDVIDVERSVAMRWDEVGTPWVSTEFPWDKDIVTFKSIILDHKLKYTGGLSGNISSKAPTENKTKATAPMTISNQIKELDKATVKENIAYNGVRTSRAEGLVVTRSDNKAKSIFNATEGISIYSDQGSGLQRNFFVGLDGKIETRGINIIGGSISWDTVNSDPTIAQVGSVATEALQNSHDAYDLAETAESKADVADDRATNALSISQGLANGTYSGTFIDNKKIMSPEIYAGLLSGNEIIGGTLNINNNFIVNSSGHMTATGATISGTLSSVGGTFTGTLVGVDGTFTGTLSGNTIIGASIIGGSMTVGSDSGQLTLSSVGNRGQLGFGGQYTITNLSNVLRMGFGSTSGTTPEIRLNSVGQRIDVDGSTVHITASTINFSSTPTVAGTSLLATQSWVNSQGFLLTALGDIRYAFASHTHSQYTTSSNVSSQIQTEAIRASFNQGLGLHISGGQLVIRQNGVGIGTIPYTPT